MRFSKISCEPEIFIRVFWKIKYTPKIIINVFRKTHAM